MNAVPRAPAQPRGVVRRQALLDAAVSLLARGGAEAVTHRAVAEMAGTAHGGLRYYFATRDQLLNEALRHIAERQVAGVAELLHRPARDRSERIAQLAHHIAGPLADDREATFARYELFLEAARRPALRPALQAWGDAYVGLFATELRAAGAENPEADAELVLNLINGLLLVQLALPRADFEDAVLRPLLERFLA